MVRNYRLGRRAEAVNETRRRIIDAARNVLLNSGYDRTSLEAVAKLAGVTRATVYQHFGSKKELLLAATNEGLDRAEVRRVRKALQHPDAAEALRGLMRESSRFWKGDYALFVRIKALAAVDPAVAEIDRLKEGVRSGHIENLVGRLEQQGLLRSGCSREIAAATLDALTSFSVFDQLHIRRKLPMRDVIAILTDLAERALLETPSGAGERTPSVVAKLKHAN